MKKTLLLLLLLSSSLIFINCSDDEDSDLTTQIVGEYIGTYGNNTVGELNAYEVTVSRVDDNTISIRPTTESDFDALEIEIQQTNSTTLSSPTDNNQQLESSVIFTTGIVTTISLNIDPTGIAHAYLGEKQ